MENPKQPTKKSQTPVDIEFILFIYRNNIHITNYLLHLELHIHVFLIKFRSVRECNARPVAVEFRI